MPASKSTFHQAAITDSNKVFKICGQTFTADKCSLASDVLKCMFDKAEKLANGTNCIRPPPGSVNAKLIESKSGSRPHFVTVNSQKRYMCDSDCAKLCSHTIACAYVDGHFLINQCRQQISMNFQRPTTKNAGKKPKQKASTKSATKAIASLQSAVQPNYQPLSSMDYQPSNQPLDHLCLNTGPPRTSSTGATLSQRFYTTSTASTESSSPACPLSSVTMTLRMLLQSLSTPYTQAVAQLATCNTSVCTGSSLNMCQHPSISISQVNTNTCTTTPTSMCSTPVSSGSIPQYFHISNNQPSTTSSTQFSSQF